MDTIAAFLASHAVATLALLVVLLLLLMLSEWLGATKRTAANGVVQLLIRVVARLGRQRTGVDLEEVIDDEKITRRQKIDRGPILRLALLLALLPCASACSPAQWQAYLAKGGVCELQAAAALLGDGVAGLIGEIDNAIAQRPTFTPDAWAARLVAGLGAAAVTEIKCRSAYLLRDLAQRPPAELAEGGAYSVAELPSTGALPAAPTKRCRKRHRPYLEALLRVRTP